MNIKYGFMFVLAACAPPTPAPAVDANLPPIVDAPPPVIDAKPPVSSDASAADEQTACDVMLRVGCQEGKIKTCARAIKLINDDFPQLGHFDLVCITTAKTIAEVKACGGQCTP